MYKFINKIWYKKSFWPIFFIPFAAVYQLIFSCRKFYLCKFRQKKHTVPIIVVGNLTVGGTGKTPLVIAIAKRFKSQGFNVGVVSRGYKSSCKNYPYKVTIDDNASTVGDEPLLIAKNTNCPVVIAKKRNLAINYLIEQEQCNLIINDDGLQHYSMGRSVEIIVIDGERGLGNGLHLPAGPLRESKSKLKKVDLIVINGQLDSKEQNSYAMNFVPGKITNLLNDNTYEPIELKHPIAGIAAIGNPNKFKETLNKMGLEFSYKSFPDHYKFRCEDLAKLNNTIIMTEKDAVKCQAFATERMYYLPIEAYLLPDFWNKLESLVLNHQNSTIFE